MSTSWRGARYQNGKSEPARNRQAVRWTLLLLFLIALDAISPLRGDVYFPRRVARTRALIVGINRYASPMIPQLHGAEIDARGFMNVITDPYTGVVNKEDVVLLLNEQATRANILSALRRTRESLKPDENLLFYYSGHSSRTPTDDLGLVPYDGRAAPSGFHPDISLENEVIPLGSTDATYLTFIGDSCSVGAALAGRVSLKYPHFAILSASKEDQPAFELFAGGGVMTSALLRALSDPMTDLDGDGLITLEEAHNEVYREILSHSRDVGILQNPSVAGRFAHKIILARVNARALAARKQSEEKPLSESLALTWTGTLDLQRPLIAILNGQEDPNLRIQENSAPQSITFLGPPSTMDRIRSGANNLTVATRGAVQNAKDSFLIFKEEKVAPVIKQAPFGHSYAVIIALSDYSGTGYPQADGMVELAQGLAADLVKQGFDVKRFYNKSASATAVDAYLRDELSPTLKPEDRVLIYYGGHGETISTNGMDVGYLVTAGATTGNVKSRGLPMKRLRSEYMDLLPAKHVLFLIDACFSGLSLLDGPPNEAQIREQKLSRYREIESLAHERMRGIITAGRKQDRAINENGGLFTRTLREAIGGSADYDGNGVITLEELYCYLWTKVGDRARSEGHEQQPQKEQPTAYGSGSFLFLYR